MRIITGKHKGRHLFSPTRSFIRPTADMVKEAIFNIFPHIWTGAKILDLYAGTGNLGIEASSRGAKLAVFMDKSRIAIQTIRKNLLTLDIETQTVIYKRDVLKGFGFLTETFQIIFMDPPYEKGYVEKTLRLIIAKPGLLTKGGLVIIEHSPREKFPFMDFSLVTFRQYGQTNITFLKRSER
jgi:16S rRNA (guanine966-N2)-methyltransferase